MEREDLRSRIIPTTIANTDGYRNDKSFRTTDLIYLASCDEIMNRSQTEVERRVSATDAAQLCGAYIEQKNKTCLGKPSTWVVLRSSNMEGGIDAISGDGSLCNISFISSFPAIQISFHFELPRKNEKPNIVAVKDKTGNILYYKLLIGEYIKTKVNDELREQLELSYHGGKLKDGMVCTGRWYTCNGQEVSFTKKYYEGRHSPEFEYQGKRYVRLISNLNPFNKDDKNDDETLPEKIQWVMVEPLSCRINNWEDMPQAINPEGTGKANFFDLTTEEGIMSGLSFYPEIDDLYSTMWQNSAMRGFLNGIDVRNITSNGNKKYVASHGGDYRGECNLLNEAFNLSRKPIIEYTIPESETSVADNAFNGCITLKKIIMHSNITDIGKNAFDGLIFNYAYITENGELILSQERPNKNEYKHIANISSLTKAFEGFDYCVLLHRERLVRFVKLSKFLIKNKFRIPYEYGLELIEKGMDEIFCKNTDFRFFRSEFPHIEDILVDYPEEERIAFFKFAFSLGCFSKEVLVNKNKNNTQVILAQKASSLLAQLVKMDITKLRKLSKNS